MGAIGPTVFEDDGGADWVAGFLRNPLEQLVASIFDKAENATNLDDREAVAALCCAEIVAAAMGNPVRTMPKALLSWAVSKADRMAPLAGDARRAVHVASTSSELSETWSEDPSWLTYLEGLTRRLG